ncbi:hypothetical protein, conserved [Entamoeba dispar SAW760]|uniref:Sel1 repeat-containing protein n=1 Tax=Entamoeba dispar (strain ATCC PRA-260 / SAW760) TaxID=370354 RepID=B0EQY3_ENTDS|nr:uncharacterized protein EDI_143710 [Entamoeba dispar SAW760]EDR23059.1 hypothetical protein, conserved [Entamoeba dispar SAW760]|eukprot:EDR23059.1 hypothetical protein, conserved [Entamoeba dispar SAW760]
MVCFLCNSQLLLGIYFADTLKQYENSFKWLTMSAEQENTIAQFKLGECYLYGKGVPKNSSKGFKWMLKAATKGYTEAQLLVSTCYFSADGVKRSSKLGFEWLLKAAQQGNVKGMNGVALCYLNGLGTVSNLDEATHWFEKAVEKGNKGSLMSLGECYIKRGQMELAFKTYKIAADNNNLKAQLFVANMLLNGEGIECDEEEAIHYLEKAAELGSKDAVKKLAEIQENHKKVNDYINSMNNKSGILPNLGIVFWILCILVALGGVYLYQISNN